jgi:hypothetical protein
LLTPVTAAASSGVTPKFARACPIATLLAFWFFAYQSLNPSIPVKETAVVGAAVVEAGVVGAAVVGAAVEKLE